MTEIGGPAPAVAVVIPAYNPGAYLSAAVDSVIAQSLSDWECVVVDDGSTEDLTWVEQVDTRVRLVRQVNCGLACARNRGITETRAPLIAFLDADDLWLPEKLATQVAAINTEGTDLVSTTFSFIDDGGNLQGPGYSSSAKTYEELLRGNGICASSVLVRRVTFVAAGAFDDRLRRVEDWDAWLRLVAMGGKLTHVGQVLALYRVHSGNMTKNYRANCAASLRVLSRHLAPAIRSGDRRILQSALAGMSRMLDLYGAQAFDAFRRGRRLPDLGWAFALAPRRTTVSVVSKAITAFRRAP